MAEDPCDDKDTDDETNSRDRPFQPAMGTLIHPVFAECNAFAEPDNRMRQPLRVAEDKIEHPADEQGNGISHQSEFDRVS